MSWNAPYFQKHAESSHRNSECHNFSFGYWSCFFDRSNSFCHDFHGKRRQKKDWAHFLWCLLTHNSTYIGPIEKHAIAVNWGIADVLEQNCGSFLCFGTQHRSYCETASICAERFQAMAGLQSCIQNSEGGKKNLLEHFLSEA